MQALLAPHLPEVLILGRCEVTQLQEQTQVVGMLSF